jgi:small multidrug resistance pump
MEAESLLAFCQRTIALEEHSNGLFLHGVKRMYLYWILLFAAILCEVIATTCMKLSVGFTRWLPSTLMFVFYSASGMFITFAIKRIELSIAYAIWAGLGVVLTTFIGIMLFKETVTTVKMISTVMIICGVLGLYLSQPTQA